LRSAQDFVKVGDVVEAVILTLDRDDRKMSLGIKQLSQDPWTDITLNTQVLNIQVSLETLQTLEF
jgi:ribosomal protein S1